MLRCTDMSSPRNRSRDKHGRFAREKTKNGPVSELSDAVQTDAAQKDAVSVVPVMGNIERLPAAVLTGDEREMQKEIDKIFDTPEINAARTALESGLPLDVALGRLKEHGHGTEVALQAIALGALPERSQSE